MTKRLNINGKEVVYSINEILYRSLTFTEQIRLQKRVENDILSKYGNLQFSGVIEFKFNYRG